jgi:ubiquinone/menaquinone biosynthesis C-methylase UbiE
MHGLLRHLHGGDDHTHAEIAAETAPQTTGSLIRWAKRYDFVVQFMAFGQARRLRRKTVEVAQIAPGERVLDVGCGTGDLTLLAKERAGSAGQVCGIDAAPEMIDVARGKAARAKAEVDFRVGVIEQLPLPADSFDVVLSSLMMHHLPDDLKPKALAEVRRVIKPGGRLLIVDFRGQLEKQSVIALVKDAGFTQVETRSLWFNMLGFVLARKAQ